MTTFLKDTSRISHRNQSVRELYLVALLLFSNSVDMNQVVPSLSSERAGSQCQAQHLPKEYCPQSAAADCSEGVVPLQLKREGP